LPVGERRAITFLGKAPLTKGGLLHRLKNSGKSFPKGKRKKKKGVIPSPSRLAVEGEFQGVHLHVQHGSEFAVLVGGGLERRGKRGKEPPCRSCRYRGEEERRKSDFARKDRGKKGGEG